MEWICCVAKPLAFTVDVRARRNDWSVARTEVVNDLDSIANDVDCRDKASTIGRPTPGVYLSRFDDVDDDADDYDDVVVVVIVVIDGDGDDDDDDDDDDDETRPSPLL
ncbi:hypothetical protein SprV_0301305100 [Sparganum proliferum]